MAFTSGNHAATAADTAEKLQATDTGSPFTYGYLSLDAAATGPARWGGANVKVTTNIGTLINPGDTIPVYATQAAEPHHTEHIYVAFSGNAAGDNIGWTIHRG